MSNATTPTGGADPSSEASPSPSPSASASPSTSALPTTTSSEQPATTGSPTDTPIPTTASPPADTASPTPTPTAAETTPTTSAPVETTPTPEPTPTPTPTSTSTSEPTTPPTTQQPPTTVPPSTLRTTTTPQQIPTTVVITEKASGTTPATTKTVYSTATTNLPAGQSSNTATASSSSPGSTGTAIGVHDAPSSGLNSSGKIAVGVVVPIAAVALLVLAGIYFWRKRKQRKEIEEQRRKEVEDYAYNPNADPTIPAVGAYEMKDDSPGYRGWGSTTLGGSSTGRKASTTMSGGVGGPALSDTMSVTPTAYANLSDTRSGEQLMGGSSSVDGEILGAMGPSAAANRTGDVHRGPSNASSSYSAAARSDESGDGGVGIAYGSGGSYGYDQYGGANPYVEGANRQGPAEAGGTPVIRDVAARRNTRIENPSHYPQQTAGISQNF